MRKLCFLFAFLIFPLFVYAQNLPQPSGWVNDFAGVISPEYKEKLSSLIEELEQKTTTEIAVVTVTSIAPYDEKEYARLLFDNWKPGKKGKDNGVLVLLAIKERRWRIETGYGVEGILPDGLCGEIGRNYMVPYFKEGKYGEGLYQGVIKIAGIISGQVKPGDIVRSSPNNDFFNWAVPLGIFLVFIFHLASWGTIFIFFIILFLLVVTLKLFSFLIALIIIFFFVCVFKILNRFKSLHSTGSYGGGYYTGGGGFGGGGFGGGGGGFGGGGGGGGGAGGGF
jgi:uncharacterized protein